MKRYPKPIRESAEALLVMARGDSLTQGQALEAIERKAHALCYRLEAEGGSRRPRTKVGRACAVLEDTASMLLRARGGDPIAKHRAWRLIPALEAILEGARV